MTIIERREQWAGHIKAQRASGQTMSKWCISNGLSIRTFKRWNKRFADSIGAGGLKQDKFIMAKITPEQETTARISIAPEREILLRLGKAEIIIQKGVDEDALSTVVRVVARIC